MRIIAGEAKGRRLRSLKGTVLRPTADRVREALFARLGDRTYGARFLDLYAGVGAVGLEALSRGAAEAVFVESHRPAARVIEQNAAACGFSDRLRLLVLPVSRALVRLDREGAQFDLLFLDPPYGIGEASVGLRALANRPHLIAPAGLVICQHSRREDVPAQIGAFAGMKQARFGETVVDFYHLKDGSGEQQRPSDGAV